jgi:dolichol-phosphate mannosyltransferase
LKVISVVVPVYKNKLTLKELTSRLCKQISLTSCSPEIILVNDACPENSWKVITELSKLNDTIIGINFTRNFGQHMAIAAGINQATGDWLVVMDADLQDQPEEIPNLLKVATDSHVDIVLAQRKNRKDSILKKLSSKLFSYLFNTIVGSNIDNTVGNFGIYSRKAYSNLQNFTESNRFFPTDIQWLGFPQKKLEVCHAQRLEGKSSYNLYKLCKLAFYTITTRTNRPLYFSIFFGGFVSMTSFISGFTILVKALIYDSYTVSGWASLMVSTFFLSGAIFFAIGILGVYIGHTYTESKKRPIFVIKDII